MMSRHLMQTIAICWTLEIVACASLVMANPKDELAAATIFVREEQTDYFCLIDGNRKKLSQRLDIAICKVTRQGTRFKSEERSQVKLINFANDDAITEPRVSKVLLSTREFDMHNGMSAAFFKTAFDLDSPITGFEYFYFPTLRLPEETIPLSVSELIMLNSSSKVTPELKGALACTCDKIQETFMLTGPYYLESKNRRLLIAGKIEHKLSLDPLKVLRMSGHAVIRAESPIDFDKNEHEAPLEEQRRVSDCSELLGEFRFRMIPRDSDESKTIKIPTELLEKENLEKE